LPYIVHMSEQDQLILTLKNDLSAAVYTYLVSVHSKLETDINKHTADDILVTVLSLNLGHVIGQLDPSCRTEHLAMSHSLILEQITKITKLESLVTHGAIGHC